MTESGKRQPPNEDLYAKWRLRPDSTQAEIQEKKKQERRRWHPDQVAGGDAAKRAAHEERFKQIEPDFEWLEDPTLRSIYDAHLGSQEKARAEDEAREARYRKQAEEAAEDAARTQQYREAFSSSARTARSAPPPPPPPPTARPPAPEAAGPAPGAAPPNFFRLVTIGFWLVVLFAGYQGCSALVDSSDDNSVDGPKSAPVESRTQASQRISQYASGGYRAVITSVDRDGDTFDVRIAATGNSDLRRPETSCVEVGDQVIPPANVRLSVDRPGHYVGSLRFPYGPAGDYRFRYSCREDYSLAPLFSRSRSNHPLQTIPGRVGVSEYDRDYYAEVGPVVLYPTSFVVYFESRGFADLRRPQESCVSLDGRSLRPTDVSLDVSRDTHYQGRYVFPYDGPGTYSFVYSCQSDYTSVALFSR